MKRASTPVVIALAALACASRAALADGAVLLPSHLLRVFSEQSQLAVVEVRPDNTVTVDLFISLLDNSGQSHQVPFVLPLQAMPGEFTMRETTLDDFRDTHLRPLQEVMDRARRADSNETPTLIYGAGALAVNPFGAILGAIFVPVYGGHRGITRRLPSPAPALSVKTEHARVDVYPALKTEELAALAQAPDLPATVAEGLKGYAGRPFALARLRTLAAPVKPPEPWQTESEPQPGIHFRFTQRMLRQGSARIYDYPLGTGKAWELPIKDTQVYVTAPDDLRLQVAFPRDSRIAFAEGIDGRQVHVAMYRAMRPDEDVRVAFLGRGATPFTRLRWIRPLRSAAAWVGFPLLAIVTWVLALRVAMWQDPDLRAMGKWRLFWRVWLWSQAATVLILSPVVAFVVFGVAFDASSRVPAWYPAGLIGLIVAACCFVLVWTAGSETRAFMGRAIRLSLLTVVAYLIVGGFLLWGLGGLGK